MKKILSFILMSYLIAICMHSRSVYEKREVREVEVLDSLMFDNLYAFLYSDSILNIYEKEFDNTKNISKLLNNPQVYMYLDIGERIQTDEEFIKFNQHLIDDSLLMALNSGRIKCFILSFSKYKTYDRKAKYKNKYIYFRPWSSYDEITPRPYNVTNKVIEVYYKDMLDFTYIYESLYIPVLYDIKTHKFYVEPDSTQYDII